MRCLLALMLFTLAEARAADALLWNIEDLRKPPKVEWLDKEGTLRKLFYESEPLNGKPTRVFACYAQPEKVEGKLPAVVCVHGGGGKAFSEWAQLWAKRGYIAIAMDLGGAGPDGKRHADAGPAQDDGSKFPRMKMDLKSIWSYHAVAAVIRAHSLLRSLPNVDPERTAITGISWGGYLTCMVAGLDDRFKVAVPVYGCGFLHENSYWLPTFAKLDEEWRKEWVKHFDPSNYVKNAKMPMLFVNGTNDFAYPLDSYQKTYRLVENRNLCVTVNMPHGHQQGWAPIEIGLFVDQYLKKGKPLYPLDKARTMVQEQDGVTIASLAVPQFILPPISKVHFHWTTDAKEPWQKRKWQSKEVPVNPGNATDFYYFTVPKERPLIGFFTVADERKAIVSTEHVILEK